MLFLGRDEQQGQRRLKTRACSLPACWRYCAKQTFPALPTHTGVRYTQHGRVFNFKSIHPTNIISYIIQPCHAGLPHKYVSQSGPNIPFSSEPGFTFENPDYSSWPPQACVRREHGSGKPWNKLDKCYFWRNVLNGMQESYWGSHAWNWVKSHINRTWEILHSPFVNSGALPAIVSRAVLCIYSKTYF